VTEPSDFISVPEAAMRLGVTQSTVVRWVLHGLLEGMQEGHRSRWRISAPDVDRLAREREG
jgi:excisionase family DNA binding protein